MTESLSHLPPSRRAAVDALVSERFTWRERLDARIDRCPGCDEWRWDRWCNRCSERTDNYKETA